MGKQESKKSVAKAPPLTDEELATKVREALDGKGLTAKQLAKLVGKAAEERALRFARDRAAAGEFFREPLDNDEWFFAEEPFATLDRVVPALLRSEGPLPAQALKKKPFAGALEQAAPGHSGLIEMWREDALKRGLLFEVPQRGGKRPTTLLSADPIEPISNERIISTVRELLQGKGVKAAELLKQVGKVFDGEGARAVELARDRAASGELFRVLKGNDEWFFSADPIATLDRVVVDFLRDKGPQPADKLKSKEFKTAIDQAAPGHSQLIEEWRKRATGHVLFEWKQRVGQKTTVFLGADEPKRATDDELVSKMREVLLKQGLTKAELSTQIDTIFKGEGPRAVDLARSRVGGGYIVHVVKGKAESFFAVEAVAKLDRVVVGLLEQNGPLSTKAVETHVERIAAGHSALLPQWQKQATARGLVFERSAPGSTKEKVLSLEPPDLKLSLGKALGELKKALAGLERQGITRERVFEFLRLELKVEAAAAPAPSPAPAKRPSREVFLEALRRFADDNPKGALLPVRELRARAGLGKQDFDSAALDLSQEGLLVLHHHDHAATLSEAEQSALVRDGRGQHYVGIALRGSA